MKLLNGKKKKAKNKEKTLVIKCGKDDVRVYPKNTLLGSNLKREEK